MMKVGVIGCGNIADIYFKNSKQYFNNFEIIACADINEKASERYAEKYTTEACFGHLDDVYIGKEK